LAHQGEDEPQELVVGFLVKIAFIFVMRLFEALLDRVTEKRDELMLVDPTAGVNERVDQLDKAVDPPEIQSVEESLLSIREGESSLDREGN
jgi:hypothetical protein